MVEYQHAHHGIQSGAEAESQLRQRQSIAREQQGVPPLPETTSQLVEIVERNEQQANWGFVLFRLDYNDDDLWDKFLEGFAKMVEKSIKEDEGRSTGIGRIQQGLMIDIVLDPQMRDARIEDVPGYVAFVPYHSIEGWDSRC